MTKFFAYIEWRHVHQYCELGWRMPKKVQVRGRVERYGTTLEWCGDGSPPVPDAQQLEEANEELFSGYDLDEINHINMRFSAVEQDEAFCRAMRKAIEAGLENPPK